MFVLNIYHDTTAIDYIPHKGYNNTFSCRVTITAQTIIIPSRKLHAKDQHSYIISCVIIHKFKSSACHIKYNGTWYTKPQEHWILLGKIFQKVKETNLSQFHIPNITFSVYVRPAWFLDISLFQLFMIKCCISLDPWLKIF